MVRLASLSLPLLLAAGAVHAQERPYVPRMSCGEAAALVSRLGAVVISTGPFTYDRAVRDEGFCPVEQTTAPLWTPSADNPQCFVGYRCKDRFTEGRDRE